MRLNWEGVLNDRDCKTQKNFINTKFLIDTEFLQEYNKYILKKGDKIMSDENNFSVDTEQLKNETKDTVNQVKDTIKNANFKELDSIPLFICV